MFYSAIEAFLFVITAFTCGAVTTILLFNKEESPYSLQARLNTERCARMAAKVRAKKASK